MSYTEQVERLQTILLSFPLHRGDMTTLSSVNNVLQRDILVILFGYNHVVQDIKRYKSDNFLE